MRKSESVRDIKATKSNLDNLDLNANVEDKFTTQFCNLTNIDGMKLLSNPFDVKIQKKKRRNWMIF